MGARARLSATGGSQEPTLRTTLRFTSVAAGVAALILLAAIILSANDWLSASPNSKQQIAVKPSLFAPQVTAPAPQPGAASGPETAPPATVSTPRPTTPVILAAAGQASTGRAAVTTARVEEKHADQAAADHRDDRCHGDVRDRHPGGRGGGGRER